jgi:hypothetical protein
LRDVLPAFGFDSARLVDTPALREVLKLLNALLPPIDRMVRETAPYLASDVFGPLFQNLPLAAWVGVGREAGLHFRGSFTSHRDLRPVVEKGLCSLLMPRSRAEVCEMLDIMQPAAFHRLLFTRQPASDPPWARHDRLVAWRPALTKLYRSRLPARSGSGSRTITFSSPAMNARVSTEMPAWQVELLRQSDGARSIQEMPSRMRAKVVPDDLAQHLYVLHQLLVIDLRPPARRVT